jgi:hypothetical protein
MDQQSSIAASNDSYHYAILTETNGGEYETWYSFIRWEGNEEAIRDLDEQFKKIRFYIIDELSTFEIEYKRLVSSQTAREMCKMDINSYMFHRKFDGKLQKIDFGFSKRDSNDDRIEKVNDKIAMGDIDQFISGEDPCDSDYESPSEVDDRSEYSDYSSDRSYSDRSDRSYDSESEDDRYYSRNSHKKDDKKDKKDDKKDDKKKDEKDEKQRQRIARELIEQEEREKKRDDEKKEKKNEKSEKSEKSEKKNEKNERNEKSEKKERNDKEEKRKEKKH